MHKMRKNRLPADDCFILIKACAKVIKFEESVTILFKFISSKVSNNSALSRHFEKFGIFINRK